MSEEMSERYVRRNVRKNVKRYVRKMSERMSEDMSEWMSKDISERMSKDMSGRMSEDKSEIMSKDMSERMSKDMSGRMSGDMSERYVKKNARRYVRKNGERYVRKNVRRYVRKNVRRHARKNAKRYVRKNVRRYVRKNGERYIRKNVRRHVRRYVRRHVRKMSERMSEDMSERMSKDMYVCTNGILWMAFCFLFDVAHCSKYCWLNFFVQGSEFGLAAMAEVVVERPEAIFIGTANRFAKGVEHVWRYKLTFVGAERMYVCMEPPSTTHAGDCMFILPEVVEGNMWYVAYEGRPVPNAGPARAGEACCSLSHFGLVLGEWSARVGDKWCAEQSHLHRRSERTTVASVGLHGLHTPWDVVVAP